MKTALRDDPNRPDPALSMISDNLPEELKQLYDPVAKRLKLAEANKVDGNLLEDQAGHTIGNRRKELIGRFFEQETLTHREQHVGEIILAIPVISHSRK